MSCLSLENFQGKEQNTPFLSSTRSSYLLQINYHFDSFIWDKKNSKAFVSLDRFRIEYKKKDQIQAVFGLNDESR